MARVTVKATSPMAPRTANVADLMRMKRRTRGELSIRTHFSETGDNGSFTRFIERLLAEAVWSKFRRI
jgi:hypothetical protein